MVLYDNVKERYYGFPVYHQRREDVASFFQDQSYLDCGFKCDVSEMFIQDRVFGVYVGYEFNGVIHIKLLSNISHDMLNREEFTYE